MNSQKTQDELKELHGHSYAEEYERTQRSFRLERLLPHIDLKPSYEVVDFGCGNGMMSALVCPSVKSYTGVDFSKRFIELANARAHRLGVCNVRFECMSIEEFCRMHPGRFDAAFAMDFSEHVYDDSWLTILKGINSSLKRGGKLYVHTPNADFFLERMKKRHLIVKQLAAHVAVRTLEENIRLLEQAGFTISSSVLMPHYNFLRVLHPLSFLPLLGRFFNARIFIEAMR